MEQLSFTLEGRQDVWTVTSLTAEIHRLLRHSFDDVRVGGEISGFKIWQSGHAYFTLKDAGAQLKCVLFRNALRYLKFKPEDGLAVVARGGIEVRQERGEYQLIVTALEPQGYGALQLAFEQLKQQLAAEGLFATERKRQLPPYPKRIGIVTSPKGAVIRDMLTVLRRRCPGLHIRLFPTLVQGEGAAKGVCEGIEHFSTSGWADVVIVGRGGGSLEDLWTFNEESVARTIASCSVPVVSAVGHETDFTIADFVADLRAPTPSAAAELIVPNVGDLLLRVDASQSRIARAIRFRLTHAARMLQEHGVERGASLLQRRIGRGQQRIDELDYASRRVMAKRMDAARSRIAELDARLRARDLRLRLAQDSGRLERAQRQLSELIRSRLNSARMAMAPLPARLGALSPLNVLERGYSIVESADGRVVRDSAGAAIGDEIRIRLHRGRIGARVESKE
jgi:exodeoxyribonuclease VII large subunit